MSALNVFVHVADAGSFVVAARELAITASAVGKSVARLEERLGVQLIHRSTRSIALTSDGVLFLERSRRILDEIDAAEAELTDRSRRSRGRLKVSLPIAGEPFLGCLERLKRRYEDVELDLDFSDRPVDLIEEGFDASVRSGAVRDSRLSNRVIGAFEMVLAASRDYLEDRRAPERESDLASHRCIRFRFPSTGRLQGWPLAGDTCAESTLPKTIVCNNLEARLSFTLAGLGIAYLPDFAIVEHLATGRLVRVLPELGEVGQFRIIWPAERRLSPRLRAFIDFFASGLLPS